MVPDFNWLKSMLAKEGFEPGVEIANRVYTNCKNRGLMMQSIGPICVFCVPFTFDKCAIDKMIGIVFKVYIQPYMI